MLFESYYNGNHKYGGKFHFVRIWVLIPTRKNIVTLFRGWYFMSLKVFSRCGLFTRKRRKSIKILLNLNLKINLVLYHDSNFGFRLGKNIIPFVCWVQNSRSCVCLLASRWKKQYLKLNLLKITGRNIILSSKTNMFYTAIKVNSKMMCPQLINTASLARYSQTVRVQPANSSWSVRMWHFYIDFLDVDLLIRVCLSM